MKFEFSDERIERSILLHCVIFILGLKEKKLMF